MADVTQRKKIKVSDFVKDGSHAVLRLTCMKFNRSGDHWSVEVCTPAGAAGPAPVSLVKDIGPVFEVMIKEGFQVDCVMNDGTEGVLVSDTDN